MLRSCPRQSASARRRARGPARAGPGAGHRHRRQTRNCWSSGRSAADRRAGRWRPGGRRDRLGSRSRRARRPRPPTWPPGELTIADRPVAVRRRTASSSSGPRRTRTRRSRPSWAGYAAAPPPDVVLVLSRTPAGPRARPCWPRLADGRGCGGWTARRSAVRRAAGLPARPSSAGPGRKADDGGLRALLDAVGTDLRDLAAACGQLAADTTGVITARSWRGTTAAGRRRPASRVADRAVEGKLAEALEQLRWALATGVVARADHQRAGAGRPGAGPGRHRRARPAARTRWPPNSGMPPWKVDRVRQQLRGWTADGVARAHGVVAEADAQVKGEGRARLCPGTGDHGSWRAAGSAQTVTRRCELPGRQPGGRRPGPPSMRSGVPRRATRVASGRHTVGSAGRRTGRSGRGGSVSGRVRR